MSRVLVDSNIWLDVFTKDASWYDWSSNALAEAGNQSILVINPVVYAEISVHFRQIEELDALLNAATVERQALPWDGAFLAGKCFLHYRRRGGSRATPLPDFFIGAHAAVAGMAVLTRDAARFRTYFPKLQLIAPS